MNYIVTRVEIDPNVHVVIHYAGKDRAMAEQIMINTMEKLGVFCNMEIHTVNNDNSLE